MAQIRVAWRARSPGTRVPLGFARPPLQLALGQIEALGLPPEAPGIRVRDGQRPEREIRRLIGAVVTPTRMVDIALPGADSLPEIDYTRYTNRQLAAVPLAVLGVALVVILGWYVLTGAPVDLGIEFTGGTEFRFSTGDSIEQVRATVGDPAVEITPLGGNQFRLETQQVNVEAIQGQLEAAGYSSISVPVSTAPDFGEAAQTQALIGLAIAFAGMAVLVFLMFRTFVPSIAVVLSAFSDIVIPIALMNVLGIQLSLGTVAALLMLIGYSVDSDILLNNHILRRSGDFYESTYRAMRTGVTMTLTSISAMTVMTIVASILDIPLLPSIGLILVFGLFADLMNTYLLNMSLLRWYKYEGVTR